MENPYQAPIYEDVADSSPKVSMRDVQRQFTVCATLLAIVPIVGISIAYSLDILLSADIRGLCLAFSNMLFDFLLFDRRCQICGNAGLWESCFRPLPSMAIGMFGCFVVLPIVIAYLNFIHDSPILNTTQLLQPIFMTHLSVLIIGMTLIFLAEKVFYAVYEFVHRPNSK